MSKNVVFIRSSADRKPEFQLTTTLLNEAGFKGVYKEASNEHAKKHLLSIVDNYDILKEAVSNCDFAEVIKESDNKIKFNFVSGNDFQTELEEYLLLGDLESSYKIIDEAFSIVDNFKVSSINPSINKLYKKVFGSSYNKKVECVYPGYIDLNLDNIFRTGSKATLIDYEWVFKFEVPKEFIKLRLVYNFFAEFQKKQLKIPGEVLKFRQFDNGYFIIEEFANRYNFSVQNINSFLKANNSFMNYVQNKQSKPVLCTRFEVIDRSNLMQALDISPFSSYEQAKNKILLDEEHIRKQNVVIRDQLEEIKKIQKENMALNSKLNTYNQIIPINVAKKVRAKLRKIKKN